MIFLDRSRAAVATGLLALWIGGTDAMLKYLRASMRPWLLAAAVGLIAIGVYGLVRRQQLGEPVDDHHDEPSIRPRIGWLLLVPIVVLILFGPQPMGDLAIDRTPNLPPPAVFDLAQYAADTHQRIPQLGFVDVLDGATQPANRAYLASHDVTLQGFVSKPEINGPGTFLFTRYLIACCAADAQPLSVIIIGRSSSPPKGQWADITAQLDTAHHALKYRPVMAATKISPIKPPANTYEALR